MLSQPGCFPTRVSCMSTLILWTDPLELSTVVSFYQGSIEPIVSRVHLLSTFGPVPTFGWRGSEGAMGGIQRHRGRKCTHILFGGALLLAGCSGAPEDGSVGFVSASSSASPTSILESTTTLVKRPESSSSTVDSRAAEREAIEVAFANQFVAWRACTSDYDACEPSTTLAEVYAGRTLRNLTDAVSNAQGRGRKNTSLDPDPDFQRVDGIEFTDVELTAAKVSYCAVDSRVVSVVDEDGVDVGFDDGVFHERGLAYYEKGEDGIWRLARFDVLLKSSQVRICDE